MNIDKPLPGWQRRQMQLNFRHKLRMGLVGSWLWLFASTPAPAAEPQTFPAAAADLLGGASKVADGAASGGSLAGLSQPGQGVRFGQLPAATKLAIRYAA